MKKKFFILCAALVWTVALMAQSIAVVKADGSTTLVRTLGEAIAVVNENDGCVVYLPGGGFPVSDDSKITKKVTIIGIGHKANNDNVDGITSISGNLFFNEGSSGSAVVGCYITGDVNIGYDETAVNDILIKFCNLNSVQVKSIICLETMINQNYIRGNSNFNNSKANILNNVIHGFSGLQYGIVRNNIFIGGIVAYESGYERFSSYAFFSSSNCTMSDNIFVVKAYEAYGGVSNITSNNMGTSDYGDGFVNLGNIDWNDVFVNYNGGAISPVSDFHFKEAYKQYESQVGIYAGDGFNDAQIAPVPYIVAKRIDEQTDASGMLNVKIRVKAGGEEE